jgi:hypothetical protein
MTDIFTAIAAALGGSACAILARRPPRELSNVRPVDRDIQALRQAAERRARNRRIILIGIILAGLLFLLILALTDTAGAAPLAACRPVRVNATVTNVSRLPAGGYEIAVRSRYPRLVASVRSARAYTVGAWVVVSGQTCGEGRIEGGRIGR